MADNTQLPIPATSGDIIAADDIGGTKFQRVKLIHGADGVNDGDVATGNPLPVQGTVALDAGTLAALETVTALGPLTDAELRASAVPVSISGISPSASMPEQTTPSLPVRQSPQQYYDVSFSQVGSGLLSPEFTQIAAGTGMTISQSDGNLVIAAGTTANAEFVARSVSSFNGALTLKEVTTLSQRIANNNFYIELVDIIGDGLDYTIVNTTTVDVTKAAHGYTAQNVGQRIDICAITGAAGIPMEGVIASIPDVNTIRFTVAGWPASGSGTCSLTGWNKFELLYTGITSTNITINTRRRGWQNTATVVTIFATNLTHIAQLNVENGLASLGDRTTSTTSFITNRCHMDRNIPLPEIDLYIQIRAKNGTAAPATTTTWTIGMVRVEDYVPTQVSLVSTRQQSLQNSLPVNVIGTVPISGSVTATGAAAHDAVISGNPVRLAGRALTAHYTAVATGDVADLVTTLVGALIQRPFAIPEQDWSYAAASGGIVNTTDVAVASAAGAGLRRYITGMTLSNNSATATEVVLKNGSTVIWRGHLAANAVNFSVVFPTPLKTTANTALNAACITTAAAVYINAQGYTAP